MSKPGPIWQDSAVKCSEAMAGRPLDEDLTVIALIESSVKELRDKLEVSSKDTLYNDDIVAYTYIARRRDPSASGQIPMNIGSREEEEFAYYAWEFQSWGGAEGPWGLDQ